MKQRNNILRNEEQGRENTKVRICQGQRMISRKAQVPDSKRKLNVSPRKEARRKMNIDLARLLCRN